jgi:hypothetical protein
MFAYDTCVYFDAVLMGMLQGWKGSNKSVHTTLNPKSNIQNPNPCIPHSIFQLHQSAFIKSEMENPISEIYENFSSINFSSANISSRSFAANKKSMSFAAANISFLVFSIDFFMSALVMYCTIGSAASVTVSLST